MKRMIPIVALIMLGLAIPMTTAFAGQGKGEGQGLTKGIRQTNSNRQSLATSIRGQERARQRHELKNPGAGSESAHKKHYKNKGKKKHQAKNSYK